MLIWNGGHPPHPTGWLSLGLTILGLKSCLGWSHCKTPIDFTVARISPWTCSCVCGIAVFSHITQAPVNEFHRSCIELLVFGLKNHETFWHFISQSLLSYLIYRYWTIIECNWCEVPKCLVIQHIHEMIGGVLVSRQWMRPSSWNNTLCLPQETWCLNWLSLSKFVNWRWQKNTFGFPLLRTVATWLLLPPGLWAAEKWDVCFSGRFCGIHTQPQTLIALQSSAGANIFPYGQNHLITSFSYLWEKSLILATLLVISCLFLHAFFLCGFACTSL